MRASVVIIGAGHAGLAMSRCLAERSVDHVVLERGEVANSWSKERWDSLRLLTPNWQSRLPGHTYSGPDPDGYRNMAETVAFLQDYARALHAPVWTQTRVAAVTATASGYRVATNKGVWECEVVVIASGACNIPNVPAVSEAVPVGVQTLTPFDYRNPEQLDEGGVLVVGASATGVQIAEEIRRTGREVALAVGEHVRLPRTYRGRDIMWWMDAAGVFDDGLADVDSVERARRLPSMQLIGSPERRTLDLNALTEQGIELRGRLVGVAGGAAQFAGSLANMVELADLKMNRLLTRLDEWAAATGVEDQVGPSERFQPTRLPAKPPLTLDLESGRYRTVVWATGFRPDHSWLDVPVFDHKGRIRHAGGVVEAPGMYLLGMPFLRTRKSSFIDGAADDARALSAHLNRYLDASPTRRLLVAAAG